MKLKKLLNENLWNERKFGEPLPTLEDTTRAYKLKQEDLVNEKVVNVGDRKYKLTPLNSIPKVEKLAYDGLVSYRGLGVFGANVFELSINNELIKLSGAIKLFWPPALTAKPTTLSLKPCPHNSIKFLAMELRS